jgi:hypothetical protein
VQPDEPAVAVFQQLRNDVAAHGLRGFTRGEMEAPYQSMLVRAEAGVHRVRARTDYGLAGQRLATAVERRHRTTAGTVPPVTLSYPARAVERTLHIGDHPAPVGP